MPLSNWRPEQDLRIGFVEPFSNTAFDAALEDASIRGDTTMHYTCGINLMWVNLLVFLHTRCSNVQEARH